MPNPRIYIADLTAYSCGITHGVWCDAARQPEAIFADIHAMLEASPFAIHHYGQPSELPTAFAIHDYEAFGNCVIRSDDTIELVAAIARGIRQHGYAFAAWADVQEGNLEGLLGGGGLEEAAGGLVAQFEAVYLGHYESLEAYVQAQLDDRGAEDTLSRLLDGSELRDLVGYIGVDVKALANDMYLGGEVMVYRARQELGGGVWVFGEGNE